MTCDGQKKVDVVGCYMLIIGFLPCGLISDTTLPPPTWGLFFMANKNPSKTLGKGYKINYK